MPGVGWDERREGFWLASNGLWYGPEDYPGGWSTTALPPAPEHRTRQSAAAMISERTKRLRDTVSDALEDVAEKAQSAAQSPTSSSGPTRRPPPPPPGGAPGPPPPRAPGPARATVTSSAVYSTRLARGVPPRPALSAPDDGFPDPPGRVSDDAAELDGPAEDTE